MALKTEGGVQQRAQRAAGWAWWATGALTVAVTVVTFQVQPQVAANLAGRPWGYLFPALAVAGLLATRWFLYRGADLRAFLSSCAYLVGMLTSVVFGLYPLVLPASTDPAYSLTVENAKAGEYGLRVGLVWWLLGMALVTAYFLYTYRHFSGKVRLEGEGY